MDHNNKDKISLNLIINFFSLTYVIALFFEVLFNREFLAGVIPIGMAINSKFVETIFSYIFWVGAFTYGLVLLLQPVLLGIAAYVIKSDSTIKAFLWTSLYLSILLDILHIIYGINNTSFNPSASFSIIYIIILISTIVLSIRYSKTWILFALLTPDFLAYGTLIGDWLIEVTKNSVFGTITAVSGELMSYAVMMAGIVFICYTIRRKIPVAKLIPFLILASVVGIIIYMNLIPGLGIMIGVVFPYVLGILGIRNWMSPFIFAIGILALASSISLYKKDKSISLSSLAIFSGSLIFDSVNTTVYLLLPLTAVVISLLLREKISHKEDTTIH
ncbi:hypothetical protein [Sulfolobus sp. E11-6]|uniref:hypothetical protein n=1 Tax=Sulfolobus sp. E11-6 TaxID=2663020 RepID=UPI0012979DF1|nr:hypothetical protein [Sulfolobus sp. E11-6]QGA69229.1 hypothetical protein GFS33_11440 [Sulfolobus sp. E11-6]